MKLNKLVLCSLMSVFCFCAHVESVEVKTVVDPVSGLSLSAWQLFTGLDFDIQAAQQDALGNWGSPVTLTNPLICTQSRNPKVAINASGNLVVIWIALDPFLFVERVYGSMYVGGVWQTATAISSVNEVILSENVDLNITNSGAVKVVWSSYLLLLQQNAIRSLFSNFGTWGSTIDTIAL